jgi:hypothetical protein
MGDLYRVETLAQKSGGFQSLPAQRRRRRRPTCNSGECGGAWPICTGTPRSLKKLMSAIWDALSTVDDSTRFSEFTRALEQPCQYQGRRVRALHPFQADDHQLLQAVNRGEFVISGLRNRDLQLLLYGYGPAPHSLSHPRRSAVVRRR